MRGFSLVELLVTLGITGILAGIALPSYHHTMQRALRQDARMALLRIQHLQERHFATHLRYAGRLGVPPDTDSLGIEPLSDSGDYALSMQSDGEGLGYIAQARAVGRQSSDRDCAMLTLDQNGQRGSEDAAGHRQLPDTGRCWY
jgi:type IV pilus assembly protein PilE